MPNNDSNYYHDLALFISNQPRFLLLDDRSLPQLNLHMSWWWTDNLKFNELFDSIVDRVRILGFTLDSWSWDESRHHSQKNE